MSVGGQLGYVSVPNAIVGRSLWLSRSSGRARGLISCGAPIAVQIASISLRRTRGQQNLQLAGIELASGLACRG